MTCDTGKIKYASQEIADQSLWYIRSRSSLRPTRKLPVRTYYCDACSAWHLTSKDERL